MKRVIFFILLLLSLPVVSAAQLSLVYDGNGNLISGDGYVREFNTLNQLSAVYNGSILLESYDYHPVEERVVRKQTYYTNGTVSSTSYYWSKEFVTIVNATGEYNITYVYHDGSLIAINTNGDIKNIISDHQGNTVVVFDSNGILESNTYEPYGLVTSDGTESLRTHEGTEQTVAGQDFNFRQYNPSYGMFFQPDTLLPNVYDPQQIGRYNFEKANPYGGIEINGHMVVMIDGGPPLWRANPENNVLFNSVRDSIDSNIDVYTYTGGMKYKELVELINEQEEDEPLVIIGYSWGGATALDLVSKLNKDNMQADALITVDATRGLASILRGFTRRNTENEGLNVNFYQSQRAIVGSLGQSQTNFINIYVPYAYNNERYNHYTITKDRDISGQIVLIVNSAHRGKYSNDLGAYVSSSGRIYPTSVKDWVPPEDR